MRLQDKVAIVTGSTQGIGEAIALRYAEEGRQSRRRGIEGYRPRGSRCSENAGRGRDRRRIRGRPAPGSAEIKALVDAVLKKFGTIDILVNNAGIDAHRSHRGDHRGRVGCPDGPESQGSVLHDPSCPAGVQTAREKARSSIVSSIWGIGAGPNCPAYCAAKRSAVNLTRAPAVEIGRENINVNLACARQYRHAAQCTPSGAGYGRLYRPHARSRRQAATSFSRRNSPAPPLTLASSIPDAVHGVTIAVDAGSGASVTPITVERHLAATVGKVTLSSESPATAGDGSRGAITLIASFRSLRRAAAAPSGSRRPAPQ